MATTSGASGGLQTLNRVVFAGQDFKTFSDENIGFLQDNYPDTLNDLVQNNIGLAILDTIAFSSMTVAFYINRRVTDLYLPTARTPNSVSKLSRLLGYKPAGASSAQVTVPITLSAGPYAFPVSIKKGFRFEGPNKSVWEYRGAVPLTFTAGEVTKNATLTEGQSFRQSFVSDFSTNQVFELTSIPAGKYVDESTITVVINNEEWARVSIIPFDEVNQYEAAATRTPPTIKFGDGVQGNVPPESVEILVTYSSTSGLKGRIGSSTIKKATDSLVVNFQTIPLVIGTHDPSVGGEDPEDIRETRVNAPKFFRSQDVCVTRSDYNTIGNLFAGVARSDAQIIRGISNEITINSYLDSIIDAVSGLDDGLANLTQPYFDSLQQSITGITADATALGTTISGVIGPVIFDIRDEVDAIVTGIDEQIGFTEATVTGLAATIKGNLADINTASDDLIVSAQQAVERRRNTIAAYGTEINNWVSGSAGLVISNVGNLVNSINSEATLAKADVGAEATATAGTIAAEVTAIDGDVDDIVTALADLHGDAATAATPHVDTINDKLDQIVTLINTEIDTFNAAVATKSANMQAQFDNINNAFDSESAGVSEQVNLLVSGFRVYLDAVLSDTCKANTVQVEVLGEDVNHKYVAPTDQLLSDLQAHLQAKADAVHTVICVSGIGKVITASALIRVKVNPLAVSSVVLNKVRTALYGAAAQPFGLFVKRNFGESMYVWKIDEAIRNAVEAREIEYVNIKLLGPSLNLDADGNLIIEKEQVIQGDAATIEVDSIDF